MTSITQREKRIGSKGSIFTILRYRTLKTCIKETTPIVTDSDSRYLRFNNVGLVSVIHKYSIIGKFR